MSGYSYFDVVLWLAYANCKALIEKEKFKLDERLLDAVVYEFFPKEKDFRELLEFLQCDTIGLVGEYTDQCMACYLCMQKALVSKRTETASYGNATFTLKDKRGLNRLEGLIA